MAWELGWPRLAPAFGILGLFLALALFNVPDALPGILHATLLGLFAAALVSGLWYGFHDFSWPRRAMARRRMERESALTHRPLQTLDDVLAGGADDPASIALWRAHRERVAAEISRLRVGWPKAGFVRRDPLALRAALALILILAAIDAGSDWRERLVRAVTPNFAPNVAAAAMTSLDIWITPPEYTGLAPQLLPAPAPKQPIPVPAGSVLLAQVHGGSQVPRLVIAGKESDFTAIDDDNYKASATLLGDTLLAVRQGGAVLGSWPIAIVPDRPPTIAFAAKPQQSERGALRIEYRATDDYGVESAKATIALVDDPGAQPLTLDLPLPGLHLKEAHAASFHDLTANPWAGLPATIQLQAADALDQKGTSETLTVTLPERVFHHPVARAIVEQRKELARHPASREEVAETLSDLSLRPALFGDDKVVFLALRTAQARLVMNRDPDTVSAVQQLLWETALRIEDGRAPLMQQDLRQAMQALQDAIARNASDAEISRLTQQLRAAIGRYLQAMAQNAQRQGLENLPQTDPSQALNGKDLQQMLDRAQDLARTGSRDAARDLLSQLEDMLESMRLGRTGQSQNSASGTMQQMMRRQQQLLDQSFRDSRNGQNNENSAAEAQDSLRRALGEMMRQLGERGDIPGALGRAERAMRGAAGALQRGQPGDAIGPQTEALDQLQQGARSLSRRMAGRNRGQGQDANGDSGDPDDQADGRRDPFGRRQQPDDYANGWIDQDAALRRGEGPEVDTGLRRAKTILDELRRRAAEQGRPVIEHEYIDRLLKEF